MNEAKKGLHTPTSRFVTIGERGGRPFEFIQANEAVTMVNVERLFPDYWRHMIEAAVKSPISKAVELKGGSVTTSLEGADFTTAYSVVKGGQIKHNLPWLYDAYEGPIKDLVAAVAGEPVRIDGDHEFGININTIARATQKGGYELHTDFNPWTALLAATDIREGDGGELLHVLPSGEVTQTRIRSGWLYIFNGREHPHKVMPLAEGGSTDIRITVPMDYENESFNEERPNDLKRIFGNGNGNGSINGLANVHDIFRKSDGPDEDPTDPVEPGRRAS